MSYDDYAVARQMATAINGPMGLSPADNREAMTAAFRWLEENRSRLMKVRRGKASISYKNGILLPAAEYFPDSWEGNAKDLLEGPAPAEESLWAVLHNGWLEEEVLREFSLLLTNRILSAAKSVDIRGSGAFKVAQDFAHGSATPSQLKVARKQAYDALSNDTENSALCVVLSATNEEAADAAVRVFDEIGYPDEEGGPLIPWQEMKEMLIHLLE